MLDEIGVTYQLVITKSVPQSKNKSLGNDKNESITMGYLLSLYHSDLCERKWGLLELK